MRSFELFTGAGGLALGTHLAGFRHMGLVEWDRYACGTLRTNAAADVLPGIREWWVHQGDVREVPFQSFGGVDLVAGGPPCQPFSIGGKHAGMEDPRDMIPQFIRAVRELQPRAFIMENVRGLIRSGFETYFSYALMQLRYPSVQRKPVETWAEHLSRLEDIHTNGQHSDLCYNVVFRVLNAADYGVPQVRYRVFVVGFRSDTRVEWHFPDETHSREALYRDQWVTRAYWDRHSQIAAKSSSDVRPHQLRFLGEARPVQYLSSQLPWQTVRDAFTKPPELPDPTERDDWSGISNHRYIPGARSYVGHTGSPLDMPAKTLKAGVHGVPGGENTVVLSDGSTRYFTVREAARLQTFPDAWRFQGSWSETMRQLGNAVPVELAHIIARSVMEKLRGGGGDEP